MGRLSYFIIVVTLYSCHQTKIEDYKDKEDSVSLLKDRNISLSDTVEDFNEFYDLFNKESSFQMSRIKYPLTGEFFDGTSKDTQDISYVWTEKDSIKYSTLDLDTALYTLERPLVNDSLVIEKIFIPNSGFQIEVHFKKINGLWFLVYYSFVDA